MSSPRRTVRSRRSLASIGVIGAGTGVGAEVLSVLQSIDGDHDAVGLDLVTQDPRAGLPEDELAQGEPTASERRERTSLGATALEGTVLDAPPVAQEGVAPQRHRPIDLSQPASLVAALRGLAAVVYVAASTDLARDLLVHPRERRDLAVRRIQALVIASAAAGVSHLVVVSSAMVYGALAANPVPLAEDAPLAAARDDGLVGDLLAVEQVLVTARDVHPGLAVTVLRPAALVGAGVDTVVTRHFEAPRLLTLKGGSERTRWQFCHVDDLASAIAATVRGRLGPVLTVASGPSLSQEEVEHLSGMRHVELSESLAFGTATRLHRAGVLPMPASDLSYAVYPWVVSSATLRAAGWSAAYDAATCLSVLLDGIRGRHAVVARRVDRKDAALGAASATVALVGTAAIMRRRRRKGS